MIKPFKTTLLDQQKRTSVLDANIRGRQKLIAMVYGKIAERKKGYAKDRPRLESLAYQLHNLYCAFEALFKFVENYFSNQIIDQQARNTKFLKRMTKNIGGVQPCVISKSAFIYLEDLYHFQQRFRHDYKSRLEIDEIDLVLKKALALKKIYQQDIANFLAQLKPATKK